MMMTVNIMNHDNNGTIKENKICEREMTEEGTVT
jgi:hypothetical protein